MTDNEKYLFDLQGYLTVPDSLTPAQLTELNSILDEHIARDCAADMLAHRFGGLLDWGQSFLDIIDNDPVTPYLELIVCPKFRLDHVYLDVIRSGTSPIGATLHGGGHPFNPSQYYRHENGHMNKWPDRCRLQPDRCRASGWGHRLCTLIPQEQLRFSGGMAKHGRGHTALCQPCHRTSRYGGDLHRSAHPRRAAVDGRRRTPHGVLQVQSPSGVMGSGVFRRQSV
jgi:hypothetical protein